MKKLINWHKLQIGKLQSLLRIDNYETLWLSWLKGIIMGIIIMSILSGCYVTTGSSWYNDPIYETSYTNVNHDLYYWNGNIYYGYYSGFYYYYGVPHYYQWWYYYSYQPAFNYYAHTHIYVQCGNGYYVYGHRGKKFNNKKSTTFKPQNTLVKSNKINSKTNPKNNYNSRPTNNNVNINKNNRNNSNKVNINKNNRNNTNKTNINKNNRNNTNKININRSKSNKSNNKSYNNKNTPRNNNSRKPR